MENRYLRKMKHRHRFWGLLLLLLLPGLLYACQAKEPPLSPAAAAFKKELKGCINRLATPLVEPVLKRDTQAIQATMKNIEPEAIRLCSLCPFRMGVMDREGNTMAVYPPRQNSNLDFYHYDVVQQAFKTRKIAQQRLYLQNGSKLYVICVPLLKDGEVIGLLALALDAGDAQKRWGLTEKEFLSLNFNQ